jgi:ketosteroid isomerase-like protein
VTPASEATSSSPHGASEGDALAADTLRRLADGEAIRSLMYSYARGVDERSLDGVLACFTDDADVALEGAVESIADLRSFYGDLFRAGPRGIGEASTHLMSNVLADVEGDSAHVVTQAVAYLRRGDVVMVRGIRYDDDCTRTSAGWRIARRRHRAEWQFEAPARAVSSLTR